MNGPVRLCCVQLFRCTGCYCPGAINAHRVITHSSDSLSSSYGPSVCHGHQFFVRAWVCLVWSYFPCGWQTVQYPGHARYISCRRSLVFQYRESMWVAMMTDSELFLQNWLQTVSVFQGVIKHMLINILIIELKDLRGSAEQYITGSSDTSPPCSLSLYREKF